MPSPVASSVEEVFIPQGVSLQGAMQISTGVDVRIAGSFEGDLVTEGSVLVEEGGVIAGEGRITCAALTVAGRVKGVHLNVDGLLEVLSTGSIESPEVMYVDISLVQGARIAGPMNPRAPGEPAVGRRDLRDQGAGVDADPACRDLSPVADGHATPHIDENLGRQLDEALSAEEVSRGGRTRSPLGRAIMGLVRGDAVDRAADVRQPAAPPAIGDIRFGVDLTRINGGAAQ